MKRHIEQLELRLLFNAVSQYWVEPYGSGNGTTPTSPGTIETVKAEIEVPSSRPASGGVTVYLGEGTYPITSTLDFGPSDSGTSSLNPVTWRASAGAHPIFSGGIPITSGWTPYENGIYKATLPSNVNLDDLWVNGARATKARSPAVGDHLRIISSNQSTGQITIPSYDGAENDGIGVEPERDAVEIVVNNSYAVYHLHIQHVATSGTSDVLTIYPADADKAFGVAPGPNINLHNGASFYLENSLALLTSPGEWYEDEATHTLYYMPKAGESNGVTVTVPVIYSTLNAPILNVQGLPQTDPNGKPIDNGQIGQAAANLIFQGITFEYNAWDEPSIEGYVGDQDGYQITDLGGTPPTYDLWYPQSPAINLGYAANVVFIQDSITHISGSGLNIYDASQDNTINQCTFSDIGGIGIDVVSRADDESVFTIRSINDTITGSLFTDVGAVYPDSAAILASFAQNLVITHNSIFDCPNGAIADGRVHNGAPGTQCVIEYNEIWNVVTDLQDDGAIYIDGQNFVSESGLDVGTVVEYNYIHDLPRASDLEIDTVDDAASVAGVYVDSGNYTTIENNVISRPDSDIVDHSGYAENVAGIHGNLITNNTSFDQSIIDSSGRDPEIGTNIEAEDFNSSYDLTVGNSGGSWQPNSNTDIVDTAASTNPVYTGTASSNDRVVYNIQTSEWLSYNVVLPESGNYIFSMTASTGDANSVVQLIIDGVNFESVRCPSTGGTSTNLEYESFRIPGLAALTAGAHTLKFLFTTAGSNLFFDRFGYEPRSYFEAEDYSSYVDPNPPGGGDTNYRGSDNITVYEHDSQSNDYIIGNISTGQSLAYNMYIPATGAYSLSLNIATESASDAIGIYLDGALQDTVALPNTGSYDNFQIVRSAKAFPITSGFHTIKLAFTGWMQFDYFIMDRASQGEAEDYLAQGDGNGFHWIHEYDPVQVYRADPVDLYSGAFANGVDVGYTETGDWTGYNIRSDGGGKYYFAAVIRAPFSGAKLTLSVDGTSETISVPVSSAFSTVYFASPITLPNGAWFAKFTYTGNFEFDYFTYHQK